MNGRRKVSAGELSWGKFNFQDLAKFSSQNLPQLPLSSVNALKLMHTPPCHRVFGEGFAVCVPFFCTFKHGFGRVLMNLISGGGIYWARDMYTASACQKSPQSGPLMPNEEGMRHTPFGNVLATDNILKLLRLQTTICFTHLAKKQPHRLTVVVNNYCPSLVKLFLAICLSSHNQDGCFFWQGFLP